MPNRALGTKDAAKPWNLSPSEMNACTQQDAVEHTANAMGEATCDPAGSLRKARAGNLPALNAISNLIANVRPGGLMYHDAVLIPAVKGVSLGSAEPVHMMATTWPHRHRHMMPRCHVMHRVCKLRAGAWTACR